MKRSFGKLLLASLAALVLASFAVAPSLRLPLVAVAAVVEVAAVVLRQVAAPGKARRLTTAGPTRGPIMSVAPASTMSTSRETLTWMSKGTGVAAVAGTTTTIRSRRQQRLPAQLP